MYTLSFVSTNADKARIIKSIFRMPIKHVELNVQEIQSLNVEAICLHKARAAYEILKQPVLVEDTGFYICAWKGLPGPLVKHFMDTVGNSGLCKMMVNERDRSVMVKSVFAVYDKANGIEKVISSELYGIIPMFPRGSYGFGWDPIFQPKGSEKTFGEMTFDEKSQFSIRKGILENLYAYLFENMPSI